MFTTEAQRHRGNIRIKLLFFSSLCLCVSVVNLQADHPEPRFEAQTIDAAISIGYGVDVGDVDGDGRPDILLADARQIVWYRNPGAPGKPWSKFIMAENLTERDNVCITARDINGDGKVEVAIGGNWNPGETSDPEKSGAIFYLIRPENPTQKWEPVQIKPHDPTTHRMRWAEVKPREFVLAVLPLHGKGNNEGGDASVRMQLVGTDGASPAAWESEFVDLGMHMTHNFDVLRHPLVARMEQAESLVIAGREGILVQTPDSVAPEPLHKHFNRAAGEVRIFWSVKMLVAAVEPMHGNRIVVSVVKQAAPTADGNYVEWERHILDENLAEGHALALTDLLGMERAQVIAGWRKRDAKGKVGIRMYVPLDDKYEQWKTYTIDDNTMACEDLKVADLDGDGKLDIIASGRATKNVIVYWNRTEGKK